MAQARRVLILSGVLLLALTTTTSGTQLATRFIAIQELDLGDEIHEIEVGDDIIFQLDTVTGDWDVLATHTRPTIAEYSNIASGPDGKLFFLQTAYDYDDAGEYRGRWYRIFSLTPEAGHGGSIVYGDEQLEYELNAPDLGTGLPDRIQQIRTGPGEGPDDYSLYFSQSWGAGQDGRIYRVVSEDTAELYYTVDLDDLDVPSCGAGGIWGGDFDFDDEGNLYLSSGASRPSGLFLARRLGSGDPHHRPELVTERAAGGMVELVYADGKLYFYDWELAEAVPGPAEEPRFDYTLYEIDLATADIQEVFSDPDVRGITSLAALPAPGLVDPGPMRFLPDVRPSDLWFGAPRLVPEDDDPLTATLELPLWISMENPAVTAASPFLLYFEARLGNDKPLAAEFIRAGHAKGGQVWKSGLPARGSVVLGGTLRLSIPKGLHVEGAPIYLRATVDSCAGEAKMPVTCRVEESNENNNVIQTQIKLPLKMPAKLPTKMPGR